MDQPPVIVIEGEVFQALTIVNGGEVGLSPLFEDVGEVDMPPPLSVKKCF